MSITTHKMLSDNDLVNNARIAQKDSYGATGKHFFDCTETATPIVDAIGGLTLADSVDTVIGAGDDSGVNTRILAYKSANDAPLLTSGAWNQPASKDVMLVMCSKHRINGGHADSDFGGFGSFTIGTTTTGQMRLQPYYGYFDLNNERFATPFYQPQKIRNDGDIGIYALVKRGNLLEHYFNGILTGSRDYSDNSVAFKAAFDNFVPDNRFDCGHSAYCKDIFLCFSDLVCTDAAVSGTCGTKPNMTNYSEEIGARFACDNTVNSTTGLLTQRSDGVGEVAGFFDPIDGNGNSTGEYADDYYGFYMGVFDSAPSSSEVISGINYCKEEWSSGNKVIYPGWMF